METNELQLNRLDDCISNNYMCVFNEFCVIFSVERGRKVEIEGERESKREGD